jgi:hypothetical protein
MSISYKNTFLAFSFDELELARCAAILRPPTFCTSSTFPLPPFTFLSVRPSVRPISPIINAIRAPEQQPLNAPQAAATVQIGCLLIPHSPFPKRRSTAGRPSKTNTAASNKSLSVRFLHVHSSVHSSVHHRSFVALSPQQLLNGAKRKSHTHLPPFIPRMSEEMLLRMTSTVPVFRTWLSGAHSLLLMFFLSFPYFQMPKRCANLYTPSSYVQN